MAVVTNIAALCALIRQIPTGSLFRHNDAGDLPAHGRRHRFSLTCRGQHKTGKAWRSRTSKSSCPQSCELIDKCYASMGPLSMHWAALRHWASSGASRLDIPAALMLARACSHLVAWTYTHWDSRRYGATIRRMIQLGLPTNVSTSSPAAAVEAFRSGLPVTLVCHPQQRKPMKLDGIPAFVCPAMLQDGFTCDDCGSGQPLCSKTDRNYIILFPSHGPRAWVVWRLIEHLWEGWR